MAPKDIFSNLTQEQRANVEAYAQEKGISIDQAIAQQVNVEISDEDLDAVSGGRAEHIEYADGTEVSEV